MLHMTKILLIISLVSQYALCQKDSLTTTTIDTLETHLNNLRWETRDNKTTYFIDDEKISRRKYKSYLRRVLDPRKCTPCYLKAYKKNKLIYEGDFYTDCNVGIYKEFYKNGNIKTVGHFRRNKTESWDMEDLEEWCTIKEGVWEYYDEKGNLTKKEEYKNGILQK